MSAPSITVVTGSSRCGTSLMMRMLHAGGVPVYCEPGNVGISFETNQAVRLPAAHAWLNECEGKAVKILEPTTFRPPSGPTYRFILMQRDVWEQAKSQVKFLRVVGGIRAVRMEDVPRLARGLVQDYPKMLEFLQGLGLVLPLRFEEVLAEPGLMARTVQAFLGRPLDTDKMAAQVFPRDPRCLKGLLEAAW